MVERVHHTKVQTPNWLLHMETILEELNEGVVIADSQHRLVFANEALIRMSHLAIGIGKSDVSEYARLLTQPSRNGISGESGWRRGL